MMMKTYCFKLYRAKRNKKLHRQINAAGLSYNHCLALHKRYWRLYHKSLSLYDLQKHLTKIKKLEKFSYLSEFGSQALQDVAERIDKGYKKFFKDRKKHKKCGLPSFKKVSKYKSFTLKTSGWKLLPGNTIVINKQKYHYFKSREISGIPKTLTVKRDSLGDIYLFIVCDTGENKVLARTGNSVGFDFGLKTFLTSSEGNEFDIVSPLFFEQNIQAIAQANKNLSRKKKGSRNRIRAKLALARLHRNVANQRNDIHWKLAYKLCSQYAVICLEELNVKALQRRFGKKISDLGFSGFVEILKYVAMKTGTKVIEVDRFYPSSQLCHVCGYKNPGTKNLSVRHWTCPKCGARHDRDRNAAMNILAEGQRILATT